MERLLMILKIEHRLTLNKDKNNKIVFPLYFSEYLQPLEVVFVLIAFSLS